MLILKGIFDSYLKIQIQMSMFCLWVFHRHECLCTTCMTVALRGQKKATDLLELELHIVVNHFVGVAN